MNSLRASSLPFLVALLSLLPHRFGDVQRAHKDGRLHPLVGRTERGDAQ